MKIFDVVEALRKHLPDITTALNECSIITDIVINENTLNIFFDDADLLKKGSHILISNVKNRIDIEEHKTINSYTYITFNVDHGLNFDRNYDQYMDFLNKSGDVVSLKLADVISDNTVLVENLEHDDFNNFECYLSNDGFNDEYEIIDTSSDFVTVNISQNYFVQPVTVYVTTNSLISYGVRVCGSATIDRFYDYYTKSGNVTADFQDWLVVTTPSMRISKDPSVMTDSISALMNNDYASTTQAVRLFAVETVQIYYVCPTADSARGVEQADKATEILYAILGAIGLSEIPTQSKCPKNEIGALLPNNAGTDSYLLSDTVYSHQYVFERTIPIHIEDMAKPRGNTAPFRGLNLTKIPYLEDVTGQEK